MKAIAIAKIGAAALSVLFMLPCVANAAAEPQVRQSGSVAYISGGVSEEARDNLQAMRQDFNLKLVLATRSGAYLSDVDVVVSDAQGQRLLDARSEGPWFFARLPSGRYTVEASANGTLQRKSVNIAGPALSTLDFRWED